MVPPYTGQNAQNQNCWLAACFIDHRNPARVEHSLESLLGQRVFALALGYEDINDHDRLRDDSLLALALWSVHLFVPRWDSVG